jgi:GDPmannose 4,6-dehydratase
MYRWEGEGFCEVGIDSASSVIRVRVKPEFYRPLETTPLLGSSAKAERVLGWKREMSFPELVQSMVEYDLAAVKNGSVFSHPV